VEDRIEALEKELAELKLQLVNSKKGKIAQLRGVLKGMPDDPALIEQAKKSLFKHASS
jgi:hypothetical protein